ncbi:hypothetical protein yc1106_09116 [Curvularia clavata]|uniref:Uncharacterized protein n=1 Tax=Curvularia clavata TaxID=95742 RepID=A0A9Q8ZH41_CURCL|nr:hypothetical protein yc1106_09116 [Curvularia clavata]
MSPLFRLPRELRDIIYDFYIRCDGGYVYNAETQKFRRADGDPISCALALTCRQAASELEGLAFQVNPITFSSTPISSLREQVALHHEVACAFAENGYFLISQTGRFLVTQEMRERVAEAYPQFAPYLEIWLKERVLGDRWGWEWDYTVGEARSIWCDFQRFLAQLISRHPALHETIKALPANSGIYMPSVDLLQRDDINFEPWRIYDKTELERLSNMLSFCPIPWGRIHPETKLTYSAASTALQFLNKCTRKVRKHIRKIILIENKVLTGRSESYGRGFIPFCRENRCLHVERRVNLWRTVFGPTSGDQATYTFGWTEWDARQFKNERLRARDVTRSVGKWMTEALALPSLGMPEESYTLVFDGNPVPELSSKVFRIIQRDAAWQAALDACYSRGLFPEVSWQIGRRQNKCYQFEGLPEVMQMLLTGSSSLIQCNFDLGAPYDVEQILEDHRGWDWATWSESWSSHEPSTFQTEPPLPPWHKWCWKQYYGYYD